MSKKITVAFAGLGSRGNSYAEACALLKDKIEIVACADIVEGKVTRFAEKYGVQFLYRDFRPYFKEGQDKARELELYMQKHCGCIFSEEDRYSKRKK